MQGEVKKNSFLFFTELNTGECTKFSKMHAKKTKPVQTNFVSISIKTNIKTPKDCQALCRRERNVAWQY